MPLFQGDAQHYVAIDLGSNSFHMLVARYTRGQLETVDRVKEMVQLARGLRPDGSLDSAARERALDCLHRFAERTRAIPSPRVRVVATKTLRSASDAGDFLREAEAALGQPIQIISGYEEARLVYLGVSHAVAHDHRKRLVVDIGGASTEFVIGRDDKAELLESLSMGCVTFTQRFLADKVSANTLRRAELAAAEEIEQIRHDYQLNGWDVALGASGTIRAIAELMPEGTPSGLITAEGLAQLVKTLGEGDETAALKAVAKQRRDVLPGGVAILRAVFEQFGLPEMHVSDGTLKEGLILDTIGRATHHDVRDRTIHHLCRKWHLDRPQARDVQWQAWQLIDQVSLMPLPDIDLRQLLGWAAQVHEIGLNLSHSGYHKHGYYILRHLDMAGFSRFEQQLLATLVGMHRRKLQPDLLLSLAEPFRQGLLQLAVVLRLAVLLRRSRDHKLRLQPRFSWVGEQIQLQFEPGWLAQHPLTLQSLEREANYLAKENLKLDFS